MEKFLIIVGTASWFLAVFTFMVATVPMYISASFIMFLIGTVFVVGGMLVMAVNRLRDLLDERLPNAPAKPGDAKEAMPTQPTDWAAWRRQQGK